MTARILDWVVDCERAIRTRNAGVRNSYRVLRYVIVPYVLSRSDFERVLFVGCAWYCRGINRQFRSREYATMDPAPSQRKHGARQHIVDVVQHVARYYEANSLDVIICNGVFGWGLNEEEQLDMALEGCFTVLRPGGLFVFGWNDIPQRSLFDPLTAKGFERFGRFVLPGLGTSLFLTSNRNRHTYAFFEKPRAEPADFSSVAHTASQDD